ncbi:MAG TPA: NrfD/PsrC family molybdoenzyme membrane anchor subunit [Syntrophorhabdaceae bacterium]|jgi:hypothetical protein
MYLDNGQVLLREPEKGLLKNPDPGPRGKVKSRPLPAYKGETYYGMPAVKSSHYGLRAGAGFFTEGIGSAAQYIATVADLFGGEGDRPMVRTGRHMASAGALMALLIFVLDLHTRSRWYNMLRLFRPTSVMSIGVWSLTKFGLLSALTSVAQLMEDFGLPRAGRIMGRIVQVPASLAGTVVSSYVGTELEETSTPFWSAGFPRMSSLVASANATAALSIMEGVRTLAGKRSEGLGRLSILTGAFALMMLQKVWESRPRARQEEQGTAVPRGSGLGIASAIFFTGKLLPLIFGRRALPMTAMSLISGVALGALVPAMLLRAGNRSGNDPVAYFIHIQTEEEDKGRKMPAHPSEYANRPEAAKKLPFIVRWGLAVVILGVAGIMAKGGPHE